MRFHNNKSTPNAPPASSMQSPQSPQPGPRPPQPGPRPPQQGPRPPQQGPRPPQQGPRPPQPGPRPPQQGPRPPQQNLPPELLPNIPVPRSVEDLQQLLSQFGPLLSSENQSFIQELIGNLQKGSDPSQLQDLAARMSQALNKN